MNQSLTYMLNAHMIVVHEMDIHFMKNTITLSGFDITISGTIKRISVLFGLTSDRFRISCILSFIVYLYR